MTSPNFRPRPADYAEMARKLSVPELIKHYKAGPRKIALWNRETIGSQRGGPRPTKRPAGFEIDKDMRVADLMAKYAVGRDVIRRWLAEIGETRPYGFQHSAAAPAIKRTRDILTFGNPLLYRRDMSEAGQAAEYLQQFGGVWRCAKTGKPDPNGKFWRRGNAVLTDAEIIERAEWMRSRRMAA